MVCNKHEERIIIIGKATAIHCYYILISRKINHKVSPNVCGSHQSSALNFRAYVFALIVLLIRDIKNTSLKG
jgi:hypothetical protein